MLDADTRRRIDTARDILVGKVPDPRSQVEQITIALIYKFMDDMDAEAEELGGRRTFFAGDYARYGWAKLMRSGLGGHETLNLYPEAIARMPENPGIPLLFRDIFKNAYLPYRDPETLRAFLKVIDEFEYDHSERLGDAFEYLLSVLGSQGDAGQFRTPRHIIDFIVEVVDPKKDETMLDPACGTAGFLISSYKHILRANTDKDGNSALTPDERGRLAQNFRGYDISPDMVRLSLVNLYLHGFNDPHIYEYDTLTSQERWNERADVILANPPFMSPKGGIKPHNRFSVQSKRSEVLFVDYMAEHLTPSGRAGIIVPEGVIFQSQTAYKKLREMLVKDFLIGVISLPSGVFMPYTGVKTSILILDRGEARRNPNIIFSDVRQIGFSLGVKRTPTEHNDLPDVLRDFRAYYRGGELSRQSWLAPRTAILANDYNLSGGRYRPKAKVGVTEMVPLREVVKRTERAVTPTAGVMLRQIGVKLWGEGAYEREPIDGGDTKYQTLFRAEEDDIVVNKIWARNGSVAVVQGSLSGCVGSGEFPMFEANRDRLLPRYFHWLTKCKQFWAICDDLSSGTSGMNRIRPERFLDVQIPLPPLDVQREIVAEVEGYQKVIDGARAVVAAYRPHIAIDPAWPMVALGAICDAILTGPFGSSLHQSDYVTNGIPVINPQNIVDGVIVKDNAKSVSLETRCRLKEFTVRENDIVIARRGEMGRCAVVPAAMDGWLCGTGSFVIRLKPDCDARFAYLQISSPQVKAYLEDQAVGVTLKNLNQGILAALRFPLPPLATQQAIVAEIEAEQALVNANRELIQRFEGKIAAALARVWGAAGQ